MLVMQKKTATKWLIAGVVCMLLFSVLTLLLAYVDTAQVYPKYYDETENISSSLITKKQIGLSTVNLAVRDALGFKSAFYKISKYAGIVLLLLLAFPLAMSARDMIRSRGFRHYPRRNYVLFGTLVLFVALYIFFDKVPVNFRPYVLNAEDYLAGIQESSYPSTHTWMSLLFGGMCVYEAFYRLEAGLWRRLMVGGTVGIAAVVLVSRILSGAHWATDILGGVFFASAILCFYLAISGMADLLDRNRAQKAEQASDVKEDKEEN